MNPAAVEQFPAEYRTCRALSHAGQAVGFPVNKLARTRMPRAFAPPAPLMWLGPIGNHPVGGACILIKLCTVCEREVPS